MWGLLIFKKSNYISEILSYNILTWVPLLNHSLEGLEYITNIDYKKTPIKHDHSIRSFGLVVSDNNWVDIN